MRRRKPMIIGYGRTSTTDQTAGLAGQERDLKAAGAAKLFTEQVSSVAQRAKLNECLAFLREGDVLMVTKPDRLARSHTGSAHAGRGGADTSVIFWADTVSNNNRCRSPVRQNSHR